MTQKEGQILTNRCQCLTI